MPTVDEKVTLQDRNQVTIPKTVVKARGLRRGQAMIVHIDEDRPNEIILRLIRESYAGALTEVFAGIDTQKYLDEERTSWE